MFKLSTRLGMLGLIYLGIVLIYFSANCSIEKVSIWGITLERETICLEEVREENMEKLIDHLIEENKTILSGHKK